MCKIEVKKDNDIDFLQIIPENVCSKMIQLKLKNDIIIDTEFIGGCTGNLNGIKNLIQGFNIKEIAEKLINVPCGSKSTSCPDQLAQGLLMYIETKQRVHS